MRALEKRPPRAEYQLEQRYGSYVSVLMLDGVFRIFMSHNPLAVMPRLFEVQT